MAKKKWGDRPDGKWLKDLPAMNQMMTTLMPNRADNEAFVSVDIDLAPLEAYLEKKNEGLDKTHRYTFFHLISAAAGKAFILRPKMNRFVCNNPRCITVTEQELDQVFYPVNLEHGIYRCLYCEEKAKYSK